MDLRYRFRLKHVIPVALFIAGISLLAACVPVDQVERPSLRQVRLGNVRGHATADTRLLPGEIAGEVTEIDRNRHDVIVRTDDGRREVLRYDFDRTRVVYHVWEYGIENLEAGDRIAFQPPPRRSAYIETIRIQEPVQARSGTNVARPLPPAPRADVIEGTVERVDHSLGVFDIRPRAGRTVTVSVPYNARSADVDSFRSLRRGDSVRVEGEFISSDSAQLLAFLSVRDR
jgi:hypothetical protein